MFVIPDHDLPPLGFQHISCRPKRGTFDQALAIAAAAHRDQLDKGGQPYIMHPIRVAQAVWAQGEAHRIVAILHDVVGDSPWTTIMLCEEEFAPDVIAAVEAMTKRKGEGYMEYLVRVAADPIARAVKIADLSDNMGVNRIVGDEGEERRRARYGQALRFFSQRPA
jgi:GTP diphosphokinase / guanosine-3',5'-bis(diphosphate) 3'-diphosphatase